MKVSVITLFPDVFEGYMSTSMMWKARNKGHLELKLIDLRDFGIGPRRQVDDIPYGGGDGMVLRADVVIPAIEQARTQNSKTPDSNTQSSKTILLTPQGKTFNQSKAYGLSTLDHLVLVCGHYEGFDERIRSYVDEELSIGDYVLTGGELPAMVVIDAAVRLIPGVLGGENSAVEESFSDGKTLEYPHYTRPEDFRGAKVPEVLRSGHHAEILKWRKEQAQVKTNTRDIQ
jgi:tRNA (guanine37-N1)-methyltransferase